MTQATSKLPRQPVPPLADTLNDCVRSVSPMLNTLQRLKSKLVFELYGASQAKQQQRLLTLAREQPVNWCAAGLTHMWLSCRRGLPFSNNYVLQLEDDPLAGSLAERAARLIAAALNLHQRIHAQALAPDLADNLPLEMDQYRNCFATHRRPRLHCDEVVTTAGSHHIAVLIQGQVYSMSVDLQRGPASLSSIQKALEHILENTDAANDDEMAPGMLSALPRDQWAQQCDALLRDGNNQQTLSLLEKALFVVCLDTDTAPGSSGGITANLRDGNSHNRFYDKSMQIVVMANGKAGLCFERSAVDGSVALGFAARLHQASLDLPVAGTETIPQQQSIRIRAAEWSLTPSLKRHLLAAKKYVVESRNQRSIETWNMSRLGLRHLKALDISPDAVAQLAIQLAVSAVTGETPSVFEPVQTRHFAGGRMDFIVPVTTESLEAMRVLRDPAASAYTIAAQVRRAAKAHHNLVQRTKSGRGLIAHLLALNAIQAGNSDGVSNWHQAVLSRLDKGLQVLFRQDVLAANGSGFPGVASFSPIGPRSDMLSIGYLLKDNEITFDVRGDGRFNGKARAVRAALEKAVVNIVKVLATCKQSNKR